MIGTLDSKVPDGPIGEKWTNHKFSMKLVPNNKRKFDVIVVGTGLGRRLGCRPHGRARLQREGIHVQRLAPPGRTPSPPRAGSTLRRTTRTTVTRSTGCSTTPTSKVATTVPARQTCIGWPRSASTSSTSASPKGCRSHAIRRPARQPLVRWLPRCPGPSTPTVRPDSGCAGGVLGAGCMRQANAGTSYPTHTEMLDLIVHDGRAVGIVTRDLITGEIVSHTAHAVVLARAASASVYVSTNAMNCNASAIWRAHRRGALFANPCFTQIHPTCIPASDEFQSKLTLMSSRCATTADGGAPANLEVIARPVVRSPRANWCSTTSRRSTRPSATWCHAMLRPATPRPRSTRARVSVRSRTGSTSTSPTPSGASARTPFASATATCSTCTSASPGRTPTRCRCASTRPPTTRWAGCGSTTSSRATFRALRHRRSQLLGPRSQPAGRLGAHAGPGRRLLRVALHHRQLPGRPAR